MSGASVKDDQKKVKQVKIKKPEEKKETLNKDDFADLISDA